MVPVTTPQQEQANKYEFTKTIQTHYSKLLNHGENLETLGSSNLRHLKQSEIR